MAEQNEPWTTQHEIQFLKNLGKKLSRPGQISMLRKYMQVISARKKWGAIDLEVVRAYLLLEIGETGKEKNT